MSHSRWKTTRERKLTEGYSEGPKESALRAEIAAQFALGQAVYDRRTELGLSQKDVADRAEMGQSQISSIEGGGTLPKLQLLYRIAHALEARLVIDLDTDQPSFDFLPHGKTDPRPNTKQGAA
ncbi:helix-turn-helix domain-containing protein [Streptomyces sp. N35]|uniref:helix-turn-helix domain-containing protein n=1 Tax=Streptomyces sp. N35 TaxID=2795730 RepID=UPI0018F72FFB|nr:helix-turn-helix domain-containing protein [Streptomyces sp. N35]